MKTSTLLLAALAATGALAAPRHKKTGCSASHSAHAQATGVSKSSGSGSDSSSNTGSGSGSSPSSVPTGSSSTTSSSSGSTGSSGSSKSWGGSNLYFLQGLSDADQTTYINNLKGYGAKVVRVWVNSQPGSGSCEKGSNIANGAPELETTIGQYNDQTLALLDKSIAKIAAAGMKALISPHDANLLNGANGDDVYGKTYGSGKFYSDSGAAKQYDARLSHILNYKSPSSGKQWKDWSEAIMGFDIQNEPMAPDASVCQNNDPSGWLCGRAKTMRGVLGNSTIQIGTGGIGGDYSHNCNLMKSALQCDSIDMISIHRYAGTEASGGAGWAGAEKGWLSQVGSKKVYVEEWGIDSTKANQGSEFPANTNDMDNGEVPWIYWQILPPKQCSSGGSDNFGIYMNGGVDLKDSFQKAIQTNAAQDWSGIVW